MKEEIGVEVKDMEKVAILNFHYPYLENIEKEWPVPVFLAKKWEEEPKEKEKLFPHITLKSWKIWIKNYD